MSSDPRIPLIRSWAKAFTRRDCDTHSELCWQWHITCLASILLAEIDRNKEAGAHE